MKKLVAVAKKHKWIMIVVLIIIVLGFLSLRAHLDAPGNLGPRLKYAGKESIGCPLPLPLGYILLCSQEPSKRYYFATDMSKEELSKYFTMTRYIDNPARGGGSGMGYRFDSLYFETTSTNEEFLINYYNDTQAVIETHKLKKTDKPHIISIADFDYQLAKSAL